MTAEGTSKSLSIPISKVFELDFATNPSRKVAGKQAALEESLEFD